MNVEYTDSLLDTVSIRGGGPAGAAAAIAARAEGVRVRLFEKSRFPRHKVCGEFFSPEIALELERIGAWDSFLQGMPARIHRMELHFERRQKISRLPEPGWGLSRYAFDGLLLGRARALGVEIVRGSADQMPIHQPMIIASGRASAGVPGHKDRGHRLFGFKAHFEGPAQDAVELYFFNRCYVGINPVESGRTNVCGLGPEDFLGLYRFDYDRVVRQSASLSARLDPLTRCMEWVSTGPLRFGQSFNAGENNTPENVYAAGDALSFVDPFTGSGLLAAVKTGALAGKSASRHEGASAYLAECRASLKKPFEIAGIFRRVVASGWADWLAPIVPGRLLFALTRPHP